MTYLTATLQGIAMVVCAFFVILANKKYKMAQSTLDEAKARWKEVEELNNAVAVQIKFDQEILEKTKNLLAETRRVQNQIANTSRNILN